MAGRTARALRLVLGAGSDATLTLRPPRRDAGAPTWHVPDDVAMRYGIVLTAGDPRTAAELAARAEDAGWDGVFTFDAIAIGDEPMFDPWVTLAAIAMRTQRVVLGAIVFAPSRRRPWKLAREAASLDVLSNGRLVLPVGLGALDDAAFGNVGEPVDARTRAELLDETLAILDGLWSGEAFAFDGTHYRFSPMTFRPTPVQRPRVPIWVVGAWPHARSMRRAARWDGVVVQVAGDGAQATLDVLDDVTAWLRVARATAASSPDGAPAPWPFDVVVEGVTPADDPPAAAAISEAHARAGATWWIEANWADQSRENLLARIAAGPPRGR